MSSNITLSAGVRQNLLSLQNTANLMATTQNRLATGKKVNSALDNPTNFFTASSLQSRAGDLNSLLDSMSTGIKTLEAADNGLKAITKTVESMQSTLRQARQDKSFKTESFSINLGNSPTGTEALSFSGGSIGADPVSISLTTQSGGTDATNAVATGTSALSTITSTDDGSDENAVLTAAGALGSINVGDTPAQNAVAAGTSALGSIDASGGDITFQVNGQTVTLADDGGTDADGNFSAQDIVDAINNQVGGTANVLASLGDNGELVITSTDTAALADTVTVDNFSVGSDATDLGFATATVSEVGSDLQPGTPLSFEVNGQAVTLSTTGGTGNDGNYSAQDIVDAINDQVGGTANVLASLGDNGELVLTSTDTAGLADAVTVDSFSSGDATQLGFAAGPSATASGQDGAPGTALTFQVNSQTVTLAAGQSYDAAAIVSAINTQVGTSAGVSASLDDNGGLVITSTGDEGLADEVTVDNFSAGDATQLGFATAAVTANGEDAGPGTTVAKSVDALVAEINSNDELRGNIRASNDNGRLRIENLSTADLDIAGASAGSITGATGASAEIGGNDSRKNLVKQFNEFRDQLDKLADDASIAGINLLRGDKLKITFNETGTSSIEIQAKDPEGNETAVNAAALGIGTVTDADFNSDASIDDLLNDLSQSLNTLRSQASNFGSNLSVVQNRTEFTKAMVNTLQTGADALVLADGNEEAANMLALQTRQQLSSTALSLASQADQAVLRLF